jgi:NAD(P)-dependent dehydrogenase (short-subunit alcohol dehydrogenase family)
MDLQLTGKRALVTGSTAGIGLAIATGLAREGAHVIINGRTPERVAEAVQSIGNAHVTGFAGDLSTPDAVQRLTDAHPDIEILVNNLGIFEVVKFEEIDDAAWERIWNTNVMSGVRLSRFYLPKMLAANQGRIIFISSESADQIPVEMIHYGVTKTAQVALARGLAESTAGAAVTINSVLAGPTLSEGVEKMLRGMPGDAASIEREFFKTARPSSLLQRFATPEEVANLVVYLASPLASATNGAAMRVEGGVVRAIF